MKEKKFLRYVDARRNNRYPFRKKQEEIEEPDPRTNQDFPGYPHAPASKELVKPKTKTEKKTAGVNTRDGEKINYSKTGEKRNANKDNGSANAFDATEIVKE